MARHAYRTIVMGLVGLLADVALGQDGSSTGLAELAKNENFATIDSHPVYQQVFSCATDQPCSRIEMFRVNSAPKECCVLSVTNGDGQGASEVSSYEVFLNGKRVLAAGDGQTAVKVWRDNAVKVVLSGKPHSKVSVLIAHGPARPKSPPAAGNARPHL